ncbi:MAG: hypothetical protein AB1772_00940 [Candidatus Zixiibacteriota bacterium]
MKPWPVYTLLLILMSSASAYDLINSRSGGLGRSVLLSHPSATDLVNSPTDALVHNAALFDMGYDRRFELADLDNLFIAGGWQYRRWTVALGLSQFGRTDLYAEQLIKGSVVLHYREFALGLMPSAMQIQFGNGYGSLRAATFGLGAGYSGYDFKVSMVSDNLTRPRFVDNGDRTGMTFTLLTEYHGHRAFSLLGRLQAEPTQKPQFGLGQWIRLSGRSAFFWGVAGEPTEYGGGLEIEIPFGAITYAASVHPVLGLSHTVSLTYRPARRSGEDDFD